MVGTTSLRHEIIAATAAGCVCTVIGHPLDTVKVHMQTSNVPTTKNTSALQTARDLLRQRALFRGMAAPMAHQVIVNSCMFGVFQMCKQQDIVGGDGSFLRGVASGLVSGLATACISTPTDYVKIQAQLRGVTSWSVLREIQTTPFRAFRGHVATMARNGIFTAVYLGLYDAAHPSGFVQICLAGSATGALAWVASFPADTIKSVIQRTAVRERLSIRQAARLIYQRQNSLAGFYRGCGPSTVRAAMVTSLRMVTYENVMNVLKK